ncbi:dyp-type peroxidase [Lasius niger]|uniref:Dyp-type peroxidase n=1 Tax=Lasius niger TaxID=67767 RepID=A0A0J7KHH9_LASNI|nr:dyp-type peroxidase [Lasius niger]
MTMKIIPNKHLPTTPQNATGNVEAYSAFIAWNINNLSDAKNLFGDLGDLAKDVKFPEKDHTFSCVCGFSPCGYEKVFGCDTPKELVKLPEIKGAKYNLTVDLTDGLFHLRASALGVIEEFLHNLVRKYPNALHVKKKVIGYKLSQNRDWLGFIDGTADPVTQEEREACVLIQSPNKKFNLGAYVLFQTYIHDLKAWDKTAVHEQEKIIGRGKLDNVQPLNQSPQSHIALNTIVVDGVEMDIVRDNAPFTTEKGERGTAFIGYSAQSSVLIQMLTNMFVGNPKGHYDHILDFSKNTFSCLYFCPNQDILDALGS